MPRQPQARDGGESDHHRLGSQAGPVFERVQTGVRMEKRLVKVLKALAELYDLSLGDLLEGIVLHAFAGRAPFSAESLGRIAELERIYGLDVEAAGHRLLPSLERQSAPTHSPAQP
jgi:hypothetical protein